MPTTQPQPHLWDGTPMAAMPYVISKGNDTPEHRVYEGMNMREHTPGKLEVLEDRRISVTLPPLVEDGGYSSHCVAMTYGGDARVSSHANARRLVACWNACDLMPTEDVERLAEIGEGVMRLSVLADDNRVDRDRLSAINAELLDALKVFQTHLEAIVASDWRKWEELATPEEFERWVKSRANHMAVLAGAAIAKAQGEQ